MNPLWPLVSTEPDNPNLDNPLIAAISSLDLLQDSYLNHWIYKCMVQIWIVLSSPKLGPEGIRTRLVKVSSIHRKSRVYVHWNFAY